MAASIAEEIPSITRRLELTWRWTFLPAVARAAAVDHNHAGMGRAHSGEEGDPGAWGYGGGQGGGGQGGTQSEKNDRAGHGGRGGAGGLARAAAVVVVLGDTARSRRQPAVAARATSRDPAAKAPAATKRMAYCYRLGQEGGNGGRRRRPRGRHFHRRQNQPHGVALRLV